MVSLVRVKEDMVVMVVPAVAMMWALGVAMEVVVGVPSYEV